MKITKTFKFLLIISCACLSGCAKEDIDKLYAEQAKQAQLISVLEEWHQIVNNNISALENLVNVINERDNIASVTPVVSGGKEIGYTISFEKASPITIYNGKDGSDGVAPIIGIKKETDGTYYWTIQTATGKEEYILDKDGNKISTSPKMRINSTTKIWEISTDNGVSWQSTGVNAVGPAGPQGPTGPEGPPGTGAGGNPIISAVNTSHNDYVEFTLANNGGSFQVPRYKNLKITINGTITPFTSGETKILSYDVVGLSNSVKAINAPQNWIITVDNTQKTITITSPLRFYSSIAGGELILIAENGAESAYASCMLTPMTGVIFYDDNMTERALVIRPKTSELYGIVVAYNYAYQNGYWGNNNTTLISTDPGNGIKNTEAVRKFCIENSIWMSTDYRVFDYAIGIARNDWWYLPAIEELENLFQILNQDSNLMNELLWTTNMTGKQYWSSTEESLTHAYYYDAELNTRVLAPKSTVANLLGFKRF